MKKIGVLITALILISSVVFAQDSLYIYKSGTVVYKRAVTAIDSIIFYKAGSGSFTCGTSTVADADGNVYNTVLIGTQCWMAQNLNVGTMINGASNQTNNNTIEKYCYNNDLNNCNTYGGLYQWAETMQYFNGATDTSSWNPVPAGNVQGICPSGWHIPTHDEWTTLERAVCTSSTCATDFPYDNTTSGLRGTDEGGKLKENGYTHWLSPNTGATNNSGFTALPGGDRNYNGTFNGVGYDGNWWVSTESSTIYAWYRFVYYIYNNIDRDSIDKTYGFSVRCIRDL